MARPKAKNPEGLQPLGFLALGLALDAAYNMLPRESNEYLPRGSIHHNTPRLFHRLSHYLSHLSIEVLDSCFENIIVELFVCSPI